MNTQLDDATAAAWGKMAADSILFAEGLHFVRLARNRRGSYESLVKAERQISYGKNF
jgi:hypothetical protein